MARKKTFYPVKDVTLPGLLSDANVILRGLSDVFTYREYATIEADLLLAVRDMIVAAIKEIEITGGIMLDAEISNMLVEVSAEAEAGIILEALLHESVITYVSAQSGMMLGSDLDEMSYTFIEPAVSSLILGGSLRAEHSDTFGAFRSGLVLDAKVANIVKEVSIKTKSAAVRLLADVNASISVPVKLSASGIALDYAITTVLRRYRELGDLEGITLADIQNWPLETYYYLEV